MKRILLLSMVFSFVFATSAWAQRTVSGKVTDESGEGLPGVNVVIKGTTTGVTSDLDGNYQISVPDENAVLVFSSVGMASQEVNVGARSVIDLGMSFDTKQLQEVVVTGYGNISREKLTGSVSSVSSQSIEQVPIASFAQTLQGNAAGVYSTTGNGQPGSTGKVLIRGAHSIQGDTDPLYVLDGVPIESGTFATLNPNDFETVSILKDAASASIYGSRAANGVIVITSKRGKAGKIQLNYRYQMGWGLPTTNFFDVLNTEQKIQRELETGQGFAGGLASDLADMDITQEFYDAQIDSLSKINNNWQDILFRTARLESHEINASGGDENTRFFASINYFNQEGITFDSQLKRYTLRFNIDNEASDKFRWGMSNSVGFSRDNSLISSGLNTNNPFLAVFLLNPYDYLVDPETGEFVVPSQGRNVLANAAQSDQVRDEVKVISSVYLEYDIIENLTARTTWGIDYRQRKFRNLTEPFNLSGFGPNKQGSLNTSFNNRPRFIGTNSLTYSRSFGSDHNASVAVFHEVWYNRFENFSTTGYGLNRIFEPNGATPGTDANGFIPVFSGSSRDEGLVSYFATGNYDYKGKYFFNATIRRDGSSRFGENNRFATFWSVGASWLLSDESFFNVSFVDNLKVRASYGTTGNKNVGGTNYYPALGTFAATSSYGGTNGYSPSSPSNPDLIWETTTKSNIGFDFGLLGGKLDGTIELYHDKTSDLFIEQQLSRTTGFTSVDINSGEMVNKGIEVTLSSYVIKNNDMFVNLFANLSYNKNEVTDLGQVDEFEQGTSIIRVGEPLGAHYITGYAGVDPATGAPLYLDTLGNVTSQFSSANATTGWGTSNAPHFGGFGTKMGYKGFTVDVLFSYIYDIAIFNNDRFFFENKNFAGFNQSTAVLRTWKEPGDITDIHSIDYPTQFSSRFIEDGSFLRLRNVTVSYALPSSVLDKVGMRSARVYFQGQNLATWTKFQGFDPESSNNITQAEYPNPKTLTVGIDIGF